MSEILLIKSPQGYLIPSGDEDIEKVRRFKVGAVIRCEVAQVRNYEFHKKWFALVKIAFDAWAETATRPQWKGEDVLPNFDRFRRDLTVLAGFYKPVFNVRGELRMEPESISFAKMTPERFEELYSQTINVILEKILPKGQFTEAALRDLVDAVMRFDA